MNKLEKIHTLKVIKEVVKTQTFGNIMFLEKIKNKNVYLTSNRLEISEPIRALFFNDAVIFQNVSKQFPPDDWVEIPK